MVNFQLSGAGGGSKTPKLSQIIQQPQPWHPPQIAPKITAAVTPVRPAAAAPQAATGGGGGSSAPAAAAAPAPVAAAPAAPAPIKDIDWFNQDSVYRGAAGRSLADLTGQLAQILAQRDSSYQQLDANRADLGEQRQDDLTSAGQDFTARGLGGSGLYADYADQVASDYAKQGAALDQTQNQLGQQYGQRNSLINLKGLNNNNGMADLSGIYGLLGSLGLQAGSQYNQAIGKAKADSAARSTAPLVQTTTW